MSTLEIEHFGPPTPTPVPHAVDPTQYYNIPHQINSHVVTSEFPGSIYDPKLDMSVETTYINMDKDPQPEITIDRYIKTEMSGWDRWLDSMGWYKGDYSEFRKLDHQVVNVTDPSIKIGEEGKTGIRFEAGLSEIADGEVLLSDIKFWADGTDDDPMFMMDKYIKNYNHGHDQYGLGCVDLNSDGNFVCRDLIKLTGDKQRMDYIVEGMYRAPGEAPLNERNTPPRDFDTIINQILAENPSQKVENRRQDDFFILLVDAMRTDRPDVYIPQR